MSMSSIFLNNKDSFKDFKLLIESIPEFPTTKNKTDEINIPGSNNGSLHIITGKEGINIPINFVFKCSDDEFFIKKIQIVKWLYENSSDKLIYSLNKEGYYKVKEIELDKFKTTSRIVRRFTVSFTLFPYMYLHEGDEIIEIYNSVSIFNNKSTCITEPRFKIYGSGDIQVNINSQTLILKGIEDNIIVDSFEKNCYKVVDGNKEYLNDKMYSKFPYLNVGDNSISFSGNISKIELTPRWCCQ